MQGPHPVLYGYACQPVQFRIYYRFLETLDDYSKYGEEKEDGHWRICGLGWPMRYCGKFIATTPGAYLVWLETARTLVSHPACQTSGSLPVTLRCDGYIPLHI